MLGHATYYIYLDTMARPSNTTLNNTKRQFYNTVVYCHNSVATLNDSGDFFNLKQLRILPKWLLGPSKQN